MYSSLIFKLLEIIGAQLERIHNINSPFQAVNRHQRSVGDSRAVAPRNRYDLTPISSILTPLQQMGQNELINYELEMKTREP